MTGPSGKLAFAYLVIGRDRPTARDARAAPIWENSTPQNPDSGLCTLLTGQRAVVGRQTISRRGEISHASVDPRQSTSSWGRGSPISATATTPSGAAAAAHARHCDGFAVETLINFAAARADLRVSEVSSYEQEHIHGESNLRAIRDGRRVLSTILRERFSAASSRPTAGARSTASSAATTDLPSAQAS